jgi:hypothetical protein
MQLTSLFTLAFVGIAIASPVQLVQQGASEITAALSNIDGKIKSFDSALKGLDKSKLASELTSIGAKGDVILGSINAANEVIQASAKLNSDEAITVASAAYALSQVSSKAIEDLIKEKAIFEKANALPAILKQLSEQKTSTLEMIKSFTTIIPADLQKYAAPANKLATDAL